MIPGEVILRNEYIDLNPLKKVKKIMIENTGDRPVQIGSHFHFYEVNRSIRFIRNETLGYRLNIPSGTTMRIEAGEQKEVELIEYGGRKRIFGHNNLTNGRPAAIDTEGNNSKRI